MNTHAGIVRLPLRWKNQLRAVKSNSPSIHMPGAGRPGAPSHATTRVMK